MSILDAAMRTNDVINEKVTCRPLSILFIFFSDRNLLPLVIEQIEKQRQAFPLPAIYFLTPSSEVVAKFIEDYTRRGPPLYQAAYLFFTGALDDVLFRRLTKSAAATHIKAVKELYVDFLTTETDVFNCAVPNAFNALYAQNSLTVAAMLNTMANQVRLLLCEPSEAFISYSGCLRVRNSGGKSYNSLCSSQWS